MAEHPVSIIVIDGPTNDHKYKGHSDDENKVVILDFLRKSKSHNGVRSVDLIVLGKEVWCLVGGLGGRLFRHPERNKVGSTSAGSSPGHSGPDHNSPEFGETILVISTATKDSVTWRCDRPFRVTKFEPVDPHPRFHVPPPEPNVERMPFSNPFPFDATANFEVNSGPVKLSAKNTQYKVTFEIEGQSVDPDLFCSP
jgi:hypothetical protein